MTPRQRVCKWCAKPLAPDRDARAEHCDDVCRRRDWGERTGYDLRAAQRGLDMRSNGLPNLPGLRPGARAVYAFIKLRGDYGATTAELCQPGIGGLRFGSYIHELRQAGCDFHVVCLRNNGRYRYWLTVDAFADVELPAGARKAAAVPSDQRVLDLAMPEDRAA